MKIYKFLTPHDGNIKKEVIYFFEKVENVIFFYKLRKTDYPINFKGNDEVIVSEKDQENFDFRYLLNLPTISLINPSRLFETENLFYLVNSCIFDFGKLPKFSPVLFCFDNQIKGFISPIEFFSRTFLTKCDFSNVLSGLGRQKDLMIFSPTKDNIFENCKIFLRISQDTEIKLKNFGENEISEIDITEIDEKDVLKFENFFDFFSSKSREMILDDIPKISIESENSTSNDGIEIKIHCEYNGTPLSEEIFPVCDKGYISHSKVFTDESGNGSFKFIPLGLDSGEKATIKVGFRLFSGISKKEITVV